jgi:L-aspartate oxidase
MNDSIPRYLVPFHPKRVPHYFTDVLVIGGGIAGTRAALACDRSLSVLVVTKDVWRESNSNYAQGGIAGVMSPQDSFSSHASDTLEAGGDLCHRDVVEMVVEGAPASIDQLIRWGTDFDKTDGQLHLGREGGHEHHRILHALGDATGREIMRSVHRQLCQSENVQLWQNTFTLDLLVHDGECRGGLVWSQGHGKTIIWARQTILCTGGAAWNLSNSIRQSCTSPAAVEV